eukprot:6180046-Pleurochrysis_carterae.AAC.4
MVFLCQLPCLPTLQVLSRRSGDTFTARAAHDIFSPRNASRVPLSRATRAPRPASSEEAAAAMHALLGELCQVTLQLVEVGATVPAQADRRHTPFCCLSHLLVALHVESHSQNEHPGIAAIDCDLSAAFFRRKPVPAWPQALLLRPHWTYRPSAPAFLGAAPLLNTAATAARKQAHQLSQARQPWKRARASSGAVGALTGLERRGGEERADAIARSRTQSLWKVYLSSDVIRKGTLHLFKDDDGQKHS